MKERVAERMREAKDQVASLRQAVADSFAAKDAGDRQAQHRRRQAWTVTPFLPKAPVPSGG
ncbi:MAG TPA: hypothetical protein VNE39_25450 [Planctomycetota bacterium]|nr:hypothetical protein [Planctomycetota bacterium]